MQAMIVVFSDKKKKKLQHHTSLALLCRSGIAFTSLWMQTNGRSEKKKKHASRRHQGFRRSLRQSL